MPSDQGSTESILVVEDDPDFRQTLVELLSGAGYRAIGVENGAEALSLMRKGGAPSLVLLDLAMPQMDGWEFRLEQKNDPNLSATPVFVITATDASQSGAIDADLVLQKPFDFKTLLERIRSQLSQKYRDRLAHAQHMLSLGELTVGLTHEVGNCLSYINGNIEHLEQQLKLLLTEEQRHPLLRALSDARSGSERIAALTRHINLYVSIEQEERKPVDLQAALDQAIRLAAHEIRQRARLVREYEELPSVKANELRLVEVFTQLLINAARAIAPGHFDENEIRVGSRLEPDGRVCVFITCSGPALRAEQLERAFDPLWSVSGPGEVTGLGLNLCQRIVGAFNGSLVLSTHDGYSTFSICFPEHAADAAARGEGVDCPLRSLRLLVVDDEITILRSLTRLLSDEHRIVTAVSGADALALLETDRDFDVILCDLMMPNVTGMELHRALKEQGSGLDQRLVFMTAGEFAEPMQSFLASVPNERISKPLNLKTLKKLLARIARGEPMSVSPTLH